jgi:hypothetical protein
MREISRGRSRTHGCSTGEEEAPPPPPAVTNVAAPWRAHNGAAEKGGLRAAAGVGGGGILRRELAAAEGLGVLVAMFGAAGVTRTDGGIGEMKGEMELGPELFFFLLTFFFSCFIISTFFKSGIR